MRNSLRMVVCHGASGRTRSRSMNPARAIKVRFWLTVSTVCALAMALTGLSVWASARPFVEEIQERQITKVAENTVLQIYQSLQEHDLLMSFLAHQPELISVALGYDDNANIVRDYLEGLSAPASFEVVTLFDFMGNPLSRLDSLDKDHFRFSSEVEQSLIESTQSVFADQGSGQPRRPIAFYSDGDTGHFLISEPVQSGGAYQGAILAQIDINLATVLPKSDGLFPTRLIAPTPPANAGEGADDIAAGGPAPLSSVRPPEDVRVFNIPNFALDVIVTPNWAQLRSVSTRLVKESVLAIGISLLAPFLLLAWFGNRLLVKPHVLLAQQQKELSELASVARNANDAILMTGLDRRVMWVNPAFETLSGFSARSVIGQRPSTILQGAETDVSTIRAISEALRNYKPIKVEILNYNRLGDRYWISLSITTLFDTSGKPYGFMAISSDITEQKLQSQRFMAAQLEIEHQSLHDALTGLPNRRALRDALDARANDPEDSSVTLVRIDLDHFKFVNDTLGHAAGDHVLCEVARILKEETKQGEVAARIGGDEFILLMSRGYGVEAAEATARRMLKRIQEPMKFGDMTARVGASFGIATTSGGMISAAEINVAADEALYRAKDSGRNAICIYTEELHKESLIRRDLVSRLPKAIRDLEFVPHYQPQVNARTGEVVGVEVLSRWQLPGGEMLSPVAYLSIAKKVGLLGEVDSALFRRAIDELSRINSDRIHVPKVSFNVTAERLQDRKLLQYMRAFSQTSDIRIAFEILESVFVEEQSNSFMYHLDLLREAGVALQIDDFGSGHASIIGLMHARPDSLKIDQQLVIPVTQSETARSLLKSIVDIANALDIAVIAEGVETYDHVRILSEIGIDILQGYYFAKPMKAEDLIIYLKVDQAKRQCLK
ncbi:putative bifunctional diguanylate cyclase/phosphodiesterase [Pseudooceanicola spongiae]|uniref:putative bifunctional diguanylate cyclase/phosphodiesterase n=1 Tax=Pseudooceanicola spongiae TaxID=2613965 RepID=UPI001865DC34|nr:EAL domain-containing protein [Pseudooceanicola spongiae]